MHRPDHSTADPDGISSGVPGYTEGNPLAIPPVVPTSVTKEQLNDVVEGLCRLVEGSGFSLVKSGYDQINDAAKAATSVTYSFESITYTRKTLDTSGVGSGLDHVEFSADGSKIYTVKNTTGTVYQYSLSTPFDVSTGTYDSVSLDVSTQDATPRSIAFKPDGLTMFMVGSTSDAVYQYTLGTAWDLSTASYASKTKSVTTEDTSPFDLVFEDDGEVMYVLGQANDTVFRYTLAVAWDVSTASYSSVSLSVSTEETSPAAFAFSDDGIIMFLLGTSVDSVTEYYLSTAWDITTAVPTGRTYAVGHLSTLPYGMSFGHGGRQMLISSFPDNVVHQFYTAV